MILEPQWLRTTPLFLGSSLPWVCSLENSMKYRLKLLIASNRLPIPPSTMNPSIIWVPLFATVTPRKLFLCCNLFGGSFQCITTTDEFVMAHFSGLTTRYICWILWSWGYRQQWTIYSARLFWVGAVRLYSVVIIMYLATFWQHRLCISWFVSIKI